MKTIKLTALFAITSMAAGVAVAQPMQTPVQQTPAAPQTMEMQNQQQPTERTRKQARKARRGGKNKQAQSQRGNPYAALHAATKLESLTTEQKARIDEFIKSHQAEAKQFRQQWRSAMQQARQAGDKQARRSAIQPLRQKARQIQKEVNSFLKETLNKEQVQELRQNAAKMQNRKVRDGMRRTRGADAGTTAAKGRKSGRDGKRQDRPGQPNAQQTPAAGARTTTGTQQVNPFDGQ